MKGFFYRKKKMIYLYQFISYKHFYGKNKKRM